MRSLTTAATATAALLLALTGCSGGDDAPDPSASSTAPRASVDPCATADPADAPAGCVQQGPPTPTGPPPPEGSSHYDAIRLEPIPGQLRTTGNDEDVDKTSDAFSVTVRKGYRFGVQGACEGLAEFTVTTVPDSSPAVKFTCGFLGAPAELGVEDPTPVTVDTTYQVRISVPAPSRWYATFYETDAPSNAS